MSVCLHCMHLRVVGACVVVLLVGCGVVLIVDCGVVVEPTVKQNTIMNM